MGREGLAVYQDDLPTPASFAALVRVLGFVVTARMPCPLCDNCRSITFRPTGNVRNNTGSRRDATAMGYTAHQLAQEMTNALRGSIGGHKTRRNVKFMNCINLIRRGFESLLRTTGQFQAYDYAWFFSRARDVPIGVLMRSCRRNGNLVACKSKEAGLAPVPLLLGMLVRTTTSEGNGHDKGNQSRSS
jgi:hypothetical protein